MTIIEIIAQKEARKRELVVKLASAATVEEIRSITLDAASIDTEVTELRAAQDDAAIEARKSAEVLAAASKGGRVILDPMGTYHIGEDRSVVDKIDTMEYRQAFKTFMQTGNMVAEYRDTTGAADVGYVIPPVVLNEIIRKLTVYGSLYNAVRKLNVKGGLTIPLITLKPAATWIADGGTTVASKQTVGSVTFNYYGLECKIATSLIVDIASIPAFEAAVVELIAEAMSRALDVAIANGVGSGSNQPLGITTDTSIAAGQKITLLSTEFPLYSSWAKKVFAKMPAAYKAGASFVMANGTFEGYINGMVDTTGQPIGRINYGITEGPQERFGGRSVLIVEDDVVKNYDDAVVGDVVAIYGNLNNYAINSNMALTMYRYLWQETNQWIDKGILIVDGKVIDPFGFILVKKGA
jgi:HK97 family phage major capsid protein